MIPPSAPIPPRSLKIALVCDWFLPRVGGLEMHMRDLALGLIRHGHEVHVVTPTPGDGMVEGIRVHRLPIRLFPYYGFICTREGFLEMESVLKRGEFDLIHCHGSVIAPAAYGGAYLGQKLGIAAVVTCHSILKYFKPVLILLNRRFKWARWPVQFSAVSEAAAAYVRPFLGGKPVHILPNGLDPEEWRVTPLSRDPHEIVIVSVMRLNIRKRPRALISLVPFILEHLPPGMRLKVRIIGEGPERKGLQAMLSRLSLGDTVELLGGKSRKEIREIFAGADMMVLPTVHESFGLSVLEARCAGLPVVAMKKSGVSEIIHHGQEGLLAVSDQDMADQMLRLIADSELRSSIAKHNRETLPGYDWDKVISLHEKLYYQAIAMRQHS